MLKDIIEVKALEGRNLFLKFEDGVEGIVDLHKVIGKFEGVFELLNDDKFFRAVVVNAETGTIAWPNDADLCQDVLYSIVSGKPLPKFAS